MDDSPVNEGKETKNNTNSVEEVDPLDAYMLEIDEQVNKLDERDKLLQNSIKTITNTAKQNVNNKSREAVEEGAENEEGDGVAHGVSFTRASLVAAMPTT